MIFTRTKKDSSSRGGLRSRRAESTLRRAERRFVKAVRKRAASLPSLANAELTGAANALRTKLSTGRRAGSDDRVDASAIVLEAVRRTTGKTFYDVQLVAGKVLADGHIAEMRTGEGKTIVAVLTAFDRVLAGDRVHIATTNSFLSKRDCEELRPAYELLGLTVGLLPERGSAATKRRAYDCDIVYGTGYELGFDYLRDQLAMRGEETRSRRLGNRFLNALSDADDSRSTTVQLSRDFALIDEIDSVLIDEAATPLVIGIDSNASPKPAPLARAKSLADELRRDHEYHIDGAERQIVITAAGAERIRREQESQVIPHQRRPWRMYVEQALRAKFLLRRDVDYVVRDDKVAIVDQNTGRIFEERRWCDGMHQAVEFREGVPLTAEHQTAARIPRQRYFQLYDRMTGMTGTAWDARRELRQTYRLGVVPIPLNRPSQMRQLPMRVFVDVEAKFRAIAEEASQAHATGQPVLIGTRTIADSRAIAEELRRLQIDHQLLNGVQDAEESAIVAAAGVAGAVTIATNMAGRGTDIRIDEKARGAGGLYVIGTEPHRTRRIDRQLAGRCARQGEPGMCRFFAAADDEVIAEFDPRLAKDIKSRVKADGLIDRAIGERIAAAQTVAERNDRQQRDRLMQREAWMQSVLTTLTGDGKESA